MPTSQNTELSTCRLTSATAYTQHGVGRSSYGLYNWAAKFSRFTVIMVVIDRLSKYAYFVPMKSDYNSRSVAEAFMTHIVKLHGVPKSIVSDRDKVFTSAFWQHLFKLQGTTLAMTSAYHPQSDGQSENLNKCLEMYLRCFTFENPKAWWKTSGWAEYWYNSGFHSSIGMTPFKALYGRDPPNLVRPSTTANDPLEVVNQLTDRDTLMQQLKSNLQKARLRMKSQADKKRRDVQFEVGDLVLVRLQPYRQHSVVLRKHQKLAMRFFGPFEVVAKVGAVAYKLKLPETAKIHSVFHVSQLKLFRGETTEPYLSFPLNSNEMGPIQMPKAVLKTRMIVQGQQTISQALILWEDNDAAAATWENVEEFKSNYPFFNLEDKIDFEGQGIVMNGQANSDSAAEVES